MNFEKRVRNPPKRFSIETTIPKPRPLEKKQRLQDENISVIGLPPKYVEISDIYLFPGNIPCSQKDDSFVIDFSWLNEFHVFKEVEKEDRNLIIHVERRTDSRFPRLKNFIKRLMKLRRCELKSWGKVMKGYYESCKRITQKQQQQLVTQERPELEIKEEDNNMKFEVKEEDSMKILQEKHSKMKECFIQLKSYFRGSESRLTEIIVNQDFVKMLGYELEDFISQMLNEGLPEIFATHDETNSRFLWRLLDELSGIQSTDLEKKTSFLEVSIKTKSGFVKRMKVQANLIFSDQNGRLESDLTFNIIENEKTDYYLPENVDVREMGQNFFRTMKEREEEVKRFMQTYYSDSKVLLNYSNLHKTCKIKEI